MREWLELRRLVPGVMATLAVTGVLALVVMSFFGDWPLHVEGLEVLATVSVIFAAVGVGFFLNSRRLAKLENAARQALPLEDGGFTSAVRAADLRQMHRWRTWVLQRPRLAMVVRGMAFVCLIASLAIWLWRMKYENSEPLLALVAWLLMAVGQVAGSLTNRNTPAPPPTPGPRKPFSFP